MKESNLFWLFVLLAASLFLTSCASRPVQTENLIADVSYQGRQHEIAHVPFINQSANHCGPATLAMVFQYHNDPIEADQISSLVYTPKMKGSLQSDMISAARRRGYMAVPITGFESLIHEVSNDHPVIVFENLALSWLPQWHYAVVYGFDMNNKTVRMHSGPEKAKTWSMEKFERSWMLADYWGLVILKPGELALSAGELSNASAAAALENLGLHKQAAASYQAVLKQWPDSLIALMGMGNLEFHWGNVDKALGYFHKAAKAHPQSVAAQHNYAELKRHQKKIN